MRARIVRHAVIGMALVVGAGGLLAYTAVRVNLYREFDLNLRGQAAQLAAMIEEEGGQLHIDWLEPENNPSIQLRGIEYYSVRRLDTGEILAESEDFPSGVPSRLGTEDRIPEIISVSWDGVSSSRCAGIVFDARESIRTEEEPGVASRDGDPTSPGVERPALRMRLVVTRVDAVAPVLRTLAWSLGTLWLGCVVLGASVIRQGVVRGLRPLNEVGHQIAGLGEGVTGQRVVLTYPAAELEPVTRELNRLLERVERGSSRERALTSNVAHELRTPIAGLISTLDVALSRGRSAEEYREAAEECFEIVKRMHWLVNNLLSISRIESGNMALRREPVVLELVLPTWWKPFATAANERRLRVSWRVDPSATVQTDPEFLRIVLGNLFDNAVSHTPAGGTVSIAAHAGGRIEIANQAGDMTASDVERVFDPFWRNSLAREDAGNHAGLGLTLCRTIVVLLGGKIAAQLREAERSFVVQLEIA